MRLSPRWMAGRPTGKDGDSTEDFSSGKGEDRGCPACAVGKDTGQERGQYAQEEDDVSRRPQEDRGSTTGAVGESEGGSEVVPEAINSWR
jgi:hypothetical protein